MTIRVTADNGQSFMVPTPADNTVLSLENMTLDVLEGLSKLPLTANLKLSVPNDSQETKPQ